MQKLKEKVEYLIEKSDIDSEILEGIRDEDSVGPFTRENRILAYLLSTGDIDYTEFEDIFFEFRERNYYQSKYLYLFDMAPRTFGQTWGEQYIRELYPEFIPATKENLIGDYPDFDGEFDLWLDGIRIEVKACRANSTKSGGSLSSRAYSHEEAFENGFKYHYQQLKPSCCDVFIWIGVCKDELLYWVLTSDELQNTGKLGSQHRNERTGVAGTEVFEGQVFMTEEELEPFRVYEEGILDVVREKGQILT